MKTIGRRKFLALTPLVTLVAPQLLAAASKPKKEDIVVTPAEDLMREHGILKRVLLIYDEVRGRIGREEGFPVETVTKSAQIIRNFIEQYHERLEEDHLFPRFRKKNRLVDLVNVLETQHKAGRRVTDAILTISRSGAKSDRDKRKLAEVMFQFGRMYAPHEAREDTVLFPAIHEIVSKHEYSALGEDFEKKEQELFGKNGFEGMVEQVGTIEKELGIFDLNQFTPK